MKFKIKRRFLKFLIALAIIVLLVSGMYFFSDWISKATGFIVG